MTTKTAKTPRKTKAKLLKELLEAVDLLVSVKGHGCTIGMVSEAYKAYKAGT